MLLNSLCHPVALVIYPVSFRLPLSTSRAIRRIGQKLRLLESIRQQQKKHDNVNTQGTTASSTSATSHENIELNALPRSSNSNNNNSAKDGLEKAIRVRIGLSSAPLLGVLLLLITTAIGGEQIKRGIAGADGVRPYDVLVLFMQVDQFSFHFLRSPLKTEGETALANTPPNLDLSHTLPPPLTQLVVSGTWLSK